MKKLPHQKIPVKKGNTKHIPKQGQYFEYPRYFNIIGLATVIILGIIIYSNTFKSPFIFDDNVQIVDNTAIRNISDVNTWWNYSTARPVSMFTFVLNYHFNQFDVRYYHLVNLIIHLINACLVWWLTLLIFSTPALKNYSIIRYKRLLAFFTALLFVSHPLATQSVTYIIQRQTAMAAMFYFLSLALYTKGRLSDNSGNIKYVFFLLALLSAILSIFSKENGYTIPLTILLFEIFLFRKKIFSFSKKELRIILMLMGSVGLLVLFMYIFSLSIFSPKFKLNIFDPIPAINGNTHIVTPYNYFITQFSVVIKYLQLLMLPINQNLDYDYPLAKNFFELKTLISFLFLLAIIVAALILFKKHRFFSFGIFWFFITLSIESTIIPLADLIYEHRTYIPSFGFFLALTSVVYLLLGKKHKYLPFVILIFIVLCNSVMTFQRNKVWKSELSLWDDVVSKSPDKARPHLSRGFAYNHLGQYYKAIDDYSRAIEIAPNYYDAYYNRGVNYGNTSQWANAASDFTKVIEHEPGNFLAYSNRGVAYGNLGQWDKSIADNDMIIKLDPGFAVGYYNRGLSYKNAGQYEKAIADFTEATLHDLKYTQAYYNRGVINKDIGFPYKAKWDFTKTLELDPKHIGAYNNRGIIFMQLENWDSAYIDFSKAVELDPDFADALQNRDIAYKKIKQKDPKWLKSALPF